MENIFLTSVTLFSTLLPSTAVAPMASSYMFVHAHLLFGIGGTGGGGVRSSSGSTAAGGSKRDGM